MELEHALPEIRRPADGARVLEICRRFASVLTDQTWNRDDVLKTHIHREVTRLVTSKQSGAPAGVLEVEKKVTIAADFLAEKEQIGFDDESDRPLYEESYQISAELREQVRPDELPDWVLDLLKKRPLFVKSATPNGELDDDAAAVLYDDEPSEPELDMNVIYSTNFDKVTEISYVIDIDGDIEDCTVTCRYLHDDVHIGERSSGWGESAIEYVSEVMDGEVVVSGPHDQDALSEADVRLFQESFDTVMNDILHPDEDDDDSDDPDDPVRAAIEAEWNDEMDSHYRRALGMIALNSQRFIGMRIK